MRFHRLTLEAIGPFPGRHEVDFDALSVSGLFLLNGPTGAGKSTLIDAIEFALFGAREEMKERMVSGHAAPGVEPFVELVFSNRRGLFRVLRTPEHDRPKQRGTGTTRVNGTARLFRLTSEDQIPVPGAGEPVTATAAETSATILDLVQLTRDQFTQTVVLPQGKFATFLTTPPDARAKVLQDVFGTEIYDLTQDRLREAAAVVRQGVEAHLREVRSAAEHLWRVGTTEELPDVTATTDLGQLVERAHAVVADVRARHDEAVEELARRETAVRAASAAEEDARALAEGLARRQESLDRLAELAAESAEVEALRDRLVRAEAADSLSPALDAYDAARAAHAVAEQRLAEHRAAAVGLHRGDEAALRSDTTLEELRDHLVEEVARLRKALLVESRLPEAISAREVALQRVEELERELATRQRALDEIPGSRDALEDELALLAAPLADLAAASAAWQQAETRMADAAALGAVTRTRDEVAVRRSAAMAECHSTQARVTALHEAWLDALAGELAAELRVDCPCPVCGSTAHPHPARRADDAPTRTDVQRARDAATAADAELSRWEAELSGLVARRTDLLARLDGHDAESAARTHDAAGARLAVARGAEHRSTEIRGLLGDLSRREDHLRAALAEITASTPAARAQLAAAETQLHTITRDLEEARGPYPTVADALQHAESRLACVGAVRAAQGDARTARHLLESAERQLSEQCAHQGFPSVGAARSARLAAGDRTAARERVTAHENEHAAHQARLREQDIARLTGEEEAHLAARQQEAAAARDAERVAAGAEGRAREVRDTCVSAVAELVATVTAHRTAVAGAAPVLRMESVARGDNERRTSLSNWVLLRRFDEVLGAANRRLGSMSDGRFELVRTEDREAGRRNRKGGLALAVRDHHIGRARSPHSLSGGETFYTSLSLALGLADVVTDEAGGVELGTLFVDEGFGSLDPHTLGNVMDVLHGLGSNGRAVGIVSHVADLKSQIAEQVEVRRLPAGGSTLVVHA